MHQANCQTAIILINWFHADTTVTFLNRLSKWKTQKPVVYVVCNGDTVEGRQALADACAEGFNLALQDQNKGFAGGNNIGMEMALEGGAQYLLLANADAWIEEADFACMLDVFSDPDSPDVVSPIIVEQHGRRKLRFAGSRDISTSRNTRILLEAQTSPKGASRLVSRDFLMGTCLLARRQAWVKTGMLDEAYFFSGEVADWCIRASRLGFRLAVDLNTEVRHDLSVAGDAARNGDYIYYSMRNRFLFIRKNHPGTRWRLYPYWLAVCGWEFAKSMAKLDRLKSKALLAAAWNGLTGKTGPRHRKE